MKKTNLKIFKETKLNLIKEQLINNLGNKIIYSNNLDIWFYYEFYAQHVWNPIPKDRLMGIIQDKYILPNSSYTEQVQIRSVGNYSLAKELEKELRLKFNGFKENNDLFIGNNKLYSFKNNSVMNIPQNVKELNIINYLPYNLEYMNK